MSGWDRVKEALRRDWEQTKHDAGLKSGHYLHQDVGDTLSQAIGKKRIPPPESPNAPRVLASWTDVELAMSYGFSARSKTGASPVWNDDVEAALRLGWEGGIDHPTTSWEDVRIYVRQGYEAATS